MDRNRSPIPPALSGALLAAALLALSVGCAAAEEEAPIWPPDPPGGPMRLAWTKVTERLDGSPFAPAGYKLHYGKAPGFYPFVLDAGPVDEIVVTLPVGGRWYFVVTSYDSDRMESGFSAEVSGAL